MVDQAKVMMPTTRITGPSTGICAKARVVSWPPSDICAMSMAGFFMIVVTSTRPVIRHTTTVSQKVPVADTRACRTGLRVCAAEATVGRSHARLIGEQPPCHAEAHGYQSPCPTSPPAAARG